MQNSKIYNYYLYDEILIIKVNNNFFKRNIDMYLYYWPLTVLSQLRALALYHFQVYKVALQGIFKTFAII